MGSQRRKGREGEDVCGLHHRARRKVLAGHTKDKEYIWDHSFFGRRVDNIRTKAYFLSSYETDYCAKNIFGQSFLFDASVVAQRENQKNLWDFEKSARFHGFFGRFRLIYFNCPKTSSPGAQLLQGKRKKQYVGNCSRKEKRVEWGTQASRSVSKSPF